MVKVSESLSQIYRSYCFKHGYGDKGTSHSYIDIYEKYINKDDVSLLEIGVCRGHSIAMWREFLPCSRIVGVDINLSEVEFDLKNCELVEGDSTSTEVSDKFKDETFDFIIDDGSHDPDDQKNTFSLFYPKLKKNGYYFIEDIRSKNLYEDFMSFLSSKNLENKSTSYIGEKRLDDIIVLVTK